MLRRPPISTPFPYTTLFRSARDAELSGAREDPRVPRRRRALDRRDLLRLRRIPEETRGTAGRFAPETEQRSEEHTSELQSPVHLVCRLLLEKKKGRSNRDGI